MMTVGESEDDPTLDYASHMWLWTATMITAQDEMDELELGRRVALEFEWQAALDRSVRRLGRGSWIELPAAWRGQ